MNQSLNILIVCEHASNKFGGEAILPLNYFRYLSKSQHVPYLITHERVKETIQSIKDIDQDSVFYVPDTKIHKLLYACSNYIPDRIGVVTIGFLMHLISQLYQWKIARRVVKSKNIDVVHEPSPVSATQPSAMFALGAPVIIGPMNGGMSFPKAFGYMSSKLEKLIYWFLPLMSYLYNIIIPGKFFADILLYANKRTLNSLPKLRLGKVFELVENGIFSTKAAPIKSKKNKGLNVLYVGRLIDLKMIDVAIDAVGASKTGAHLTVVGDGPDREKLESYAKSKQLSSIIFTGLVAHADINQYYDEADIFVLPSVRECGGAVVLEAMARGLPVIATNWGGPVDYITEETGYLVDPVSRESMVSEFTRIIDLLSKDCDLRYIIGKAAIARVKAHFLWDLKIEKMIEFYKQLAEKNTDAK